MSIIATGDGIIFVRERDERFKAPWNWHELPVDQDGGSLSNVTSREPLIIEQRTGRKIWIESLHQYPTYAGLLAGLPQARDSSVEQAVRAAGRIFGEDEKLPAMLKPRLIRLRPSGKPTLPLPDMPAARLPATTSIAIFNSPPVSDELFRSSAVVIWFQENYGLPTDERTLTQLRELDWAAHAWDWNP